MAASRKSRIGGAFAVAVLCGGIVWSETHHAIPAFRAWTFGCVFLILAVGTGLAGGRGRDLLLGVTTLAFGLCALEVVAAATQPKKVGGFDITPFWITLKPEVGFGFTQAGIVHARRYGAGDATIFDANYTIGATFDRAVQAANDGPATVFFGDSFTFGEGVNDRETLPQRFADLAGGRRVLNLAVSGYSPQQFLREVETGLRDDVIGPKPSAFVFLTSPFHAARTACKESWTARAPRYALEGGRAVYQGPCFAGARLMVHEFLGNTALYRRAIQPYVDRLTHADIDLYIAILAEAAQTSKQRYGVKTLVPFIRAPNSLAGTGYDDDAVIAALKARGVWVVDMDLPGALYAIAGDGHPTGAANAVRARMVAEALTAASAPVAGVSQ